MPLETLASHVRGPECKPWLHCWFQLPANPHCEPQHVMASVTEFLLSRRETQIKCLAPASLSPTSAYWGHFQKWTSRWIPVCSLSLSLSLPLLSLLSFSLSKISRNIFKFNRFPFPCSSSLYTTNYPCNHSSNNNESILKSEKKKSKLTRTPGTWIVITCWIPWVCSLSLFYLPQGWASKKPGIHDCQQP